MTRKGDVIMSYAQDLWSRLRDLLSKQPHFLSLLLDILSYFCSFSASAKEFFFYSKKKKTLLFRHRSSFSSAPQIVNSRSQDVFLSRAAVQASSGALHSLTEWRCHFTAGDLWSRWGQKLHRTSVRLETFQSGQVWCGRGGFPARGGVGVGTFLRAAWRHAAGWLVHRSERLNHGVDREGGARTLTASPSESRHQE